MKHKKHMDAEVQVKTKAVDADDDGQVESGEKRRAKDIGAALERAFGDKKHMKKDEKEDKKESNGLTPAQRKLPPKLQAAILKSKSGKGKKHMDADDDLESPEKADLDKDGKLSPYEKKRGKAVEASMRKDCSCGCDDPKECTCDDTNENNWSGRSLPTFQEWLEWRDNQS